eukprot:2747787-Rhodomonas_salina.2
MPGPVVTFGDAVRRLSCALCGADITGAVARQRMRCLRRSSEHARGSTLLSHCSQHSISVAIRPA